MWKKGNRIICIVWIFCIKRTNIYTVRHFFLFDPTCQVSLEKSDKNACYSTDTFVEETNNKQQNYQQ